MKRPHITAGDWHPRKHVFGSKVRDKETGFVVEGADPKAQICGIHCSPEAPFTVARANAQAIAALPLCLAALETLLSRTGGMDISATHDGLQNCEAIAKARSALLAAGYTE